MPKGERQKKEFRKRDGIHIVFSRTDARDIALWDAIRAQSEGGGDDEQLNLSAMIKALLWRWFELRHDGYSVGQSLLTAPVGIDSAGRYNQAPPSEKVDIDIDDDLARSMFNIRFDDA